MLNEFLNLLTFETIYIWVNLGILPFWLMMITIPNSRITKILLNSIFIPLILASLYCYIIYQGISSGENYFVEIYKLYFGIDNLYSIFSNESFLLIFWLHFLLLSIFLGTWVWRDSIKYNISRSLAFISILLVYFFSPVGIVFYWFVRIFYAKKIGLHD